MVFGRVGRIAIISRTYESYSTVHSKGRLSTTRRITTKKKIILRFKWFVSREPYVCVGIYLRSGQEVSCI
jgi:hypothetical protein